MFYAIQTIFSIFWNNEPSQTYRHSPQNKYDPNGAVFYPVSVLPAWLQKIAYLLPSTYVFEGMRQVLATGVTVAQEWPTPDEIPAKILLAAMLGLWYALGTMIPLWHEFTGMVVGYFLVGWILWLALMHLDKDFILIGFGLFPQTFLLLPFRQGLLATFCLVGLLVWQEFRIDQDTRGLETLVTLVALA